MSSLSALRRRFVVLPPTDCLLEQRCPVTDQDRILSQDLPIDALPEPRCQATTQSGSRCRNRPLEGQRYCRVHIALDGQASALPSEAVALESSSAEDVPIEFGRDPGADAAVAVQEVEVEIRNQGDAPAATRDFLADLLRLIRENLARM